MKNVIKGTAVATRERVLGRDTAADDAKAAVKGARRTVRSTAKDAGGAARSAFGDVRKTARGRYLQGRLAAARASGRASASRSSGSSKKGVAAAGAAGVAGAYFLDPKEGTRRRHIVRDRALALFRKGTDRARQQASYRKGQAEGKVEALKSKARPEKDGANDQTLAERVKSEIFQPADAPKGSVSVNVERGVVYLRGEVPKDRDVAELVKRANSVDGVNGVESLLHSG
jgi:osmotically-inducible protein OsmY